MDRLGMYANNQGPSISEGINSVLSPKWSPNSCICVGVN